MYMDEGGNLQFEDLFFEELSQEQAAVNIKHKQINWKFYQKNYYIFRKIMKK